MTIKNIEAYQKKNQLIAGLGIVNLMACVMIKKWFHLGHLESKILFILGFIIGIFIFRMYVLNQKKHKKKIFSTPYILSIIVALSVFAYVIFTRLL
jgi:hypothetical protein